MDSSKPTLLFIHGFRGSPLGLAKLTSFFSDSFNIYTPSIPPFGDSLPLVEYSPSSYADFIADYIKANHLNKPILIGHSMGSIIASATAEKYPELINNKLILVSPIPAKTSKYIANTQPLVTVLSNKTLSHISTRFLFVPRHSYSLYKETLNTTILCGETHNDKHDVLLAANFSANNSVSDFDFKKHTLLIAGEKDRLVRKRATIALANRNNFSLKFIPNTGHLVNYENPKAVADLIREFLAQ